MTARGRFSHEKCFDRDGRRDEEALWSARSRDGMVVTAHYLATAAGVSMLERGGNAVDAAIACSMALGVCESAGSGLGGMALGVVHLAQSGRTFVLDGACRAPASASPDEVSRSRRYHGYRAVAVPRHVAALEHLHRHYGRCTVRELLAPAIRLAEDGFPITSVQHGVAADYARHLRKATAAEFFLNAEKRPFAVGTVFRQPVLARTLRQLSERGLSDFYVGDIADEIVRDMERNDGFVARADLRAAQEVSEVAPLSGHFDGGDVLVSGPPAGGLTLVQMLHMAGSRGAEELDLRTAEGTARVAAIIRRARRDRKRFRLRTGAEDVGEARALLDPNYCEKAAADAMGETSHLIVWDREDNVVSMTQSVERSYGAAVVTPSLGFVHNGYLRAFKVKNVRHPHYLKPGAPARSNAAPTIIFRNGRPDVVVGSTGSERMCSGILEVLLRLRTESPFEAVHAPRFHCTPTGEVLWEEERFDPRVRDTLTRAGLELEPLDAYSFKMGGLQLAVREQNGESLCGVTEPRRDGAAGGPIMVERG